MTMMQTYDSRYTNVVPTARTRSIATYLINDARNSTGADAVTRIKPLEPGQAPALLGLLLDAAAGNQRRIDTGEAGRPVQRGMALPCPTCGAKPWKPCTVPSGWASRPHAARRGKRCVHCAEPINEGRYDYCSENCREIVRKERDRQYQRQARAARKASTVSATIDSLPVDDRYSMSEPQVMLEAAKNKATRTADCANSRLWSGSSHPHSAKNGSD